MKTPNPPVENRSELIPEGFKQIGFISGLPEYPEGVNEVNVDIPSHPNHGKLILGIASL